MDRCEGTVSKDFLRSAGPGRETRCKRIARYAFRKKKLCGEHASMILLDEAKKSGAIKLNLNS